MEKFLIAVMELQDAKNHQVALQKFGVELEFKTNGKTCTTGCKVTVEVWGNETDSDKIQKHFQSDYLKHLKGHEPDFSQLSAVFDTSAAEVICQACGAKFAPSSNECPDCGLIY
jgi:ribosomal protein S27E